MRTATRVAFALLATVALPAECSAQDGPSPNGRVGLVAAVGNEIVSLTTRLVVPEPAKPQRQSRWNLVSLAWPSAEGGGRKLSPDRQRHTAAGRHLGLVVRAGDAA